MIISIDPGLSGAIVVINSLDGGNVNQYSKLSINAFKMPLNGKELNISEIINIIQGARLVYIEKQQPMSKQGVTSTFTTGKNYGILQGIIATLRIPVIETSSQKWKAKYGLKTGNKEDVLHKAKSLYPELELPKSKIFAIAICDALLMSGIR